MSIVVDRDRSATSTEPASRTWARTWPGPAIDIQGHRGARGVVAESTLPSFLAAFEAGVTGIELDVRLTADGHVVVWHDPRIQADKCLPTGADLVGARVDELTLEQLRTIDVGTRTLAAFPGQRQAPGARIPTLGEVLALGAAHAPGVWWTIELKLDPTEPRVADTRSRMLDGVVAAVEVAGTGPRSLVHSFDWAVLELARERVPHLQRSALAVHGVTYAPGSPWLGGLEWTEHGDDDLPGAVQAIGAHVVAPHHHAVDRSLVARAHALGLGVLPWTVNEPEDLRRVLGAGVDGVVTDYPARALDLIGAAATGRRTSRADTSMA